MADNDRLGQFVRAVPPVPRTYDPVWFEQVLNEILANLNLMAQAVWLLTDGKAVGDRTNSGASQVDENQTIDGDTQNGYRFSNANATQHLVHQLPAATTERELEFSIDSAYDVYLVPASGERFQLGTADQLMKLTGQGTLVRIGCTTAGVWRILRLIGTTPTYSAALRYTDGTVIHYTNGAPMLRAA